MDKFTLYTSIDHPLAFIIPFLVIIASIILHEIAHGYVAYRCGDYTAKLAGRLTFNPIPHIDPIGTIGLPILLTFLGSPVVFGWAKPVPINYRALRGGERDFFWVSFAGIAVNLTLALIAAASLHLYSSLTTVISGNLFTFTATLVVFYNILLALFNLIPVPPLDGSRLLRTILPLQYKGIIDEIEPYGFLLIFLALYLAQDRLAFSVIKLTMLLIG